MKLAILECSGNYSCKSDAILSVWRVLTDNGYSFKYGDYSSPTEWYKDSGCASRAIYRYRGGPVECAGSACYGEPIDSVLFKWRKLSEGSYDFTIMM